MEAIWWLCRCGILCRAELNRAKDLPLIGDPKKGTTLSLKQPTELPNSSKQTKMRTEFPVKCEVYQLAERFVTWGYRTFKWISILSLKKTAPARSLWIKRWSNASFLDVFGKSILACKHLMEAGMQHASAKCHAWPHATKNVCQIRNET